MAGVAVVQHGRRADEQSAHLDVPHDPAGGGVPVEAVARADVAMQAHALQHLDQRAGVAVHDRLRHAGRAGRVHDPERMRGRHLRRFERDIALDQRGPRDGAGRARGLVPPVQVRHEHGVPQRRQRRAHLGEQRAAVVVLAAVAVAVGRDQHLGRDLAKAVEHRHRAHVRRTHRPHRADARAREEGDHGLRNVRQDRDQPVAGHHAERAQRGGEGRHLALEFAPGHFVEHARFVAGEDRGALGRGVAKHLVDHIEPRAREPLRTGHRAPAEHPLVRYGRADVEEMPDRAPEPFKIGDRPAPQRLVIGEGQPALALQPREERRDAGTRDALRRRLPQGLDVGHRRSAGRIA